jgi:hypothetical protein
MSKRFVSYLPDGKMNSIPFLRVTKLCNYRLFVHYPSSYFYSKQCFGEWTLPLSLGKNLLRWAKSTQLVLVSIHVCSNRKKLFHTIISSVQICFLVQHCLTFRIIFHLTNYGSIFLCTVKKKG